MTAAGKFNRRSLLLGAGAAAIATAVPAPAVPRILGRFASGGVMTAIDGRLFYGETAEGFTIIRYGVARAGKAFICEDLARALGRHLVTA